MNGFKGKLLVRPMPFADESWYGYLLRLSSVNGMTGLSSIARICNMKKIALVRTKPSSILKELGISIAGVEIHPSFSEADLKNDPAKSISDRSNYSCVCPQCLKEDRYPYIRSEWDRYTVLHCEIHYCLIVDVCQNCFEKLDYHRNSITLCTCGFDLGDSKLAQIPIFLSTFYRIFDVHPYDVVHGFPVVDIGNDLAASKLANKMLKISRIVSEESKSSIRFGGRAGPIPIDAIEFLEKIFKDWPNGFVETLLSYDLFHKRGWSLTHPDKLKGEDFAEVDEVVKKFYGDRFRRKALRRTYKPMPVLDNGDFVSRNEFSVLTGFSNMEIDKLISSNQLDGVVIDDSKYLCRRYAIPKRHIFGVGEIARSWVDVGGASVLLGATELAVRKLVIAGILTQTSIFSVTRKYRIHPDTLNLFRDSFVSAERFNASRHGQIICTSAAIVIVSKRGKLALVRFFKSVMSGNIVRLRCCKNPRWLDDIFFELEAVTTFEASDAGVPRKAPTLRELSGL